jgi:hypothetical protein
MTIAAHRIEHLNDRPGWDCRVCGGPWPCANAKANLLAEFEAFPSVLTIYLSGQLCDAIHDLASNDKAVPPDLYDRFVSWARADCPTPPDTAPTLNTGPQVTRKPPPRRRNQIS